MELYQLEYFRVIAETGNLHEAAEQLHVAQPSLSRCIKSLEEELGASLFDRAGRNIVLNQAGEIALRRAKVTLDAASSIKDEVDAYVRRKKQTLNLYMPVPIGDDERVLFSFREKHPDIHMRIAVAPADSLVGEKPDLTFFASPYVHDAPNYCLLGEEEIVLVVPANSNLASRESVPLAEVAKEDFTFSMPGGHRDMCESMFAEVGIEPHVVMENHSYEQVMHSVALGYGYALVPSITWFSSPDIGVVGVPLSDVHRSRYLYMKRREGTTLSESACLLRDFLIEHFNEISSKTKSRPED